MEYKLSQVPQILKQILALLLALEVKLYDFCQRQI